MTNLIDTFLTLSYLNQAFVIFNCLVILCCTLYISAWSIVKGGFSAYYSARQRFEIYLMSQNFDEKDLEILGVTIDKLESSKKGIH